MKQLKNKTSGKLFETLEARTLCAGTPLTITQGEYLGGTQLKIAGTAGNDQITVTNTTGGLLVTNTGGWSQKVIGTFKSIRIDGKAGNDTITVDAAVKAEAVLYGSEGDDNLNGGGGNDRLYTGAGRDKANGGAGNDTIVTVGGGTGDSMTGGAGTDSFWTDTNETITDVAASETAVGAVHRISSFMSYWTPGVEGNSVVTPVSKELTGQNLLDPVTTSNTLTYANFSNNPLFSDAGPKANDVQQGAVGDCYFLAVLSSVAKTGAQTIRQSVVDLGDGTFAVQFSGYFGTKVVRVDADLPTYSWGTLAYAKTGAAGSVWVGIMEKAYAFFRSSQGTYESISGGWMSEAYMALGKQSSSSYSSTNSGWLMDRITTDLASGKSVTYAVNTAANGAPLVGCHAYTVDAVIKNSAGTVTGLRLRNPWGVDGAGNDGCNDGYVTITAAQAHASFLGVTSAAL